MKEETKYTELIIHFLEKRVSDADLEHLKVWCQQSDENRKFFDEINERWQVSEMALKPELFNPEKNWIQLREKIRKYTPLWQPRIISTRHLYLWKAAAVIALFVSFTFSGLYFFQDKYESKESIVTVQAPRGEKAKVILADGSLVWLNSGSEIAYSNSFGVDDREVFLKGEGYFDVVKDSLSSFIVNVGQCQIKVFGTKFNVSAYPEDEQTVATLEEGSISMKSKGRGREVSIHPGQQAVLNNQTGNIKLQGVNTEMYTSWKESKLKFFDAPFGEVVKKLERWYDVKIVLDEGLKYTERYTMTLKTESLREVLKFIQITTPLEYKIDEDVVFIFPKSARRMKR